MIFSGSLFYRCIIYECTVLLLLLLRWVSIERQGNGRWRQLVWWLLIRRECARQAEIRELCPQITLPSLPSLLSCRPSATFETSLVLALPSPLFLPYIIDLCWQLRLSSYFSPPNSVFPSLLLLLWQSVSLSVSLYSLSLSLFVSLSFCLSA